MRVSSSYEFIDYSKEQLQLHIGDVGFQLEREWNNGHSYGVIFNNGIVRVGAVWEPREESVEFLLSPYYKLKMSEVKSFWSYFRGHIKLIRILEVRAPEYIVFPAHVSPQANGYLQIIIETYSAALREYASDVLGNDFSISSSIRTDWTLKCLEMISRGQLLRKGIRIGDVFAMKLKSGQFIFGRVMKNDVCVLKQSEMLLIYIYRDSSTQEDLILTLYKDNLLLPPLITFESIFKGPYIKIVGNVKVNAEDLLSVHCFKDSKGVCHDEYNHECACTGEMCGPYRLVYPAVLDDLLYEVLK